MIVGHVMGLPVEESVLALAPAGAATVTAVALAARTTLDRLRRRRDGSEGRAARDHSSVPRPDSLWKGG